MTKEESRRQREQNRKSWNSITPIHNSHKKDQAAYLRSGEGTLFPDELELLGAVAGESIAHLQCNCGQDTLSLVQLGAVATGIDISDSAIQFAQNLARDSALDAEFIRSDIFDWLESTPQRFDTAFASYGVIGWLDDLPRWTRGIARILEPGGRFVLLEFHPLVWSLGQKGLTGDPYFLDGPIFERGGVNDYVGEGLSPSGYLSTKTTFENPEPGYSYQWGVGDIVQSLLTAGLQLESIREYPYANGCEIFDGMEALPGRRFGMPAGLPSLPLMLGVIARTPADERRRTLRS